jgi:hypothetical protein
MGETWKEIDRYLRAKRIRIGPPTPAQTTGGKHVPTSYHYHGTARDYGIHDSDAPAVARALRPIASQLNSPIAELFFSPLNIWYKHGHITLGSRIGGHQDHCHVALELNRHMPSVVHGSPQGVTNSTHTSIGTTISHLIRSWGIGTSAPLPTGVQANERDRNNNERGPIKPDFERLERQGIGSGIWQQSTRKGWPW